MKLPWGRLIDHSSSRERLGREPAILHRHPGRTGYRRAAFDRFHEAGLVAGGTDNGAPDGRNYHPGYHAAFLIDPDGNNIEAVHHGPAESVTISFGE